MNALASAVARSDAAIVLAVRGIVKTFGGTHALRGVDAAFRAGEVHAIVGENGAGKSTLTRVLTGAVRCDAGRIEFEGKPVHLPDPQAARRLGIRMVHQHDTLVPHLDVAENILLGQLPRQPRTGLIDWSATRRRARGILDELGYPGMSVRSVVGALSTAQRQIVEIAKALSATPRVLILDEPSAPLAQEDIDRLFTIVRRLRDRGVAIVYISHRLEEIFQLADRVTVLRDGAVSGAVAAADTDKAGLIRMMVGRPIEDLFPKRTGRRPEPALVVRELSRAGAFQQVSFALGKGEIVGMYGLIGSGRTDVARCLYGADRIGSGSITWEGRPFVARSPREALRAGIALLTEDRLGDGLVRGMSILDNMSLASLPAVCRFGFIDRARQRRRVGQQVRKLGIRPAEPERDVATLSGGNQQKVVLGKWLLTDTRLLILDEPTRGVDIASRRDIYELIGQLADDGMSVLLVSSDLPEVIGMCDRILVMREGRIAGTFPRDDASEERLLACASGIADGFPA